MSTYIPSSIDERAFEQAQHDALAAYAPQKIVYGSGFLAGFTATWLPGLIVIPLLYLYRLTVGSKAWMTAEEKHAEALQQLLANLGGYSRVAIWVAIILGLYGILQAWLRQRSCLTNRFTTIELAKYGEVRFGLDAKITILGFPVAAIIFMWLTNQLLVLVLAIFLIALSGFFYQNLWQKLDDFYLKRLFKIEYDENAALALRLMVPRHVGWSKIKVAKVEVNRGEKTVRIEGEFESETDEKETRNIVGHFMRGYHPIYIVNTKKVAS